LRPDSKRKEVAIFSESAIIYSMTDVLDLIADILIKYYPPIGNIQHKYITKVTAIGLLKSANVTRPDYYAPYYERLKSYKSLVQNLMDNFKMSNIVALKIMCDIIERIRNDEKIDPDERHKSASFLSIVILLNRKLGEGDSTHLLEKSKSLYKNLANAEACEEAAASIIDQCLTDQKKYDELAGRIVRKCLTEVKQEAVLKNLESAVYIFFVYAYFDPRMHQLRYEITFKHNKNFEQLEPFFHLKMLSRSIISLVTDHRTIINFFGEHIQNFDEIRQFFSKNPNITVMFF
jgi:hypothetical protein